MQMHRVIIYLCEFIVYLMGDNFCEIVSTVSLFVGLTTLILYLLHRKKDRSSKMVSIADLNVDFYVRKYEYMANMLEIIYKKLNIDENNRWWNK